MMKKRFTDIEKVRHGTWQVSIGDFLVCQHSSSSAARYCAAKLDKEIRRVFVKLFVAESGTPSTLGKPNGKLSVTTGGLKLKRRKLAPCKT